ncbi:hypothetical protein CHCC15290_4001 [Bacillus licheniformis]|jgi:hypothetical protein|nr:hypothetical protein CPQ91_07395 [Bacillus licheniformis]EQM28581.1 hypothetical protein N399_07975 [Bacillus licheniformis CG-B52]MBJ7887903.1 hypothetical protein [Bacillaceae bacterium HSR45]OLQ52646.1 hypothetical protein BHT95_07170 [Bacillus paralicheniformis]KYC70602.1 hypothetical protein B4092_1001 [Bacillus licheniformis]
MKDKKPPCGGRQETFKLGFMVSYRYNENKIIVQDGKPADTELTAFTLFVWCPFFICTENSKGET